MKLIPLFPVLCFAVLAASCGSGNSNPESDTTAPADPRQVVQLKDETSLLASLLVTGMTLEEVIDHLGEADWASIPGDTGEFQLYDSGIALELRWSNPGCSPVVAAFDRNMILIDWDDGTLCFPGAEAYYPDEGFSCDLPDRHGYCVVQDSLFEEDQILE